MSFSLPYQNQGNSSVDWEIRPGRSVHSVRPGETLGSIAKLHGTSELAIRRLNPHLIGRSGHVSPDMRLEILG